MTIKEAREKAGMTQQQVSDLLSIPKRTIENWEGGQRKPPAWAEKLVTEKIVWLKKNNRTLSLEEFCRFMQGAESRHRPGVTVGCIDIVVDGEEIFSSEWAYNDIEENADGEPTPAGWKEIERQDERCAEEAYEAYKNGESEFVY